MKLRPLWLLYVALALFALATPVLRWLMIRSNDLGLANAISFCNVLFVGNFCAGASVALIFGFKNIVRDLRETSPGGKGLLAVNVLLAVAIPSLLFTALQTTSVINVVLLSRFQEVMMAVFGVWFAGGALAKRQWLGYGVISVGIVSLVLWQGMGQFMQGDCLVMLSSLFYAVSALMSKGILKRTTQRLFIMVRNFCSAIVFFIIACYLYGFEHFADAFVPGLWVVMLFYALIIVVVAQFAWYGAIRSLPTAKVVNASMLAPFLSVGFAYLLLGEVPQTLQVIAGAIIVVGMVLTRDKKVDVEVTMQEKSLAGA